MPTNAQDFHLELLKQKTQSLLIAGRYKQEILGSIGRLQSKDIISISDALDDIDHFIREKYEEIENRAKNVGLN